MFSYAVVIRTLGNTGEKYRALLEAIRRQTVKPEEVIVVIPNGCSLDYTLGTEHIMFSEKGMVTQRAIGIAEAKAEYLLVVDDDLDFSNDFVEKLYKHMRSNALDCVLAFHNGDSIQNESNQVSKKNSIVKNTMDFLMRVRLAFTGQAFYSHRKSHYFDTITTTGGHRTYVRCKEMPCQTGCFQVFFIKRDKAKAVKFEEELWLQQGSVSSYAAYDDAVFFYKLFLQGGRLAYCLTTSYTHLDAATGRIAKDKISAKRIRLYSIARNRTIFWYRYIWSNHRNLHTLLGGLYGMINYAVYSTIINLIPKNWPAVSALFQGYRDAYKVIREL